MRYMHIYVQYSMLVKKNVKISCMCKYLVELSRALLYYILSAR